MAYGNEVNIERVPVKMTANEANTKGFTHGLVNEQHPASVPNHLLSDYKTGFEFGKSCLGAQFEMGRV